MKYDVLSLGPARMDVFVNLPLSNIDEKCFVDNRKCVIELGFGAKVPVGEVNFSVGGNTGNNAVGLSRLGFKVAMVGALGDQPVDDQVRTVLKEEGVGVNYLEKTSGLGGYGVVMNYGAERTILSYYGEQPEKFLPNESDVDAGWMYLTTAGEKYEAFYKQAVEWKGKRGVKLAFNPGTRQVKDRQKNNFVYEQTDLLFVNREEAAIILDVVGNDIPLMFKGLSQLGAKVIVITDGPNGAFAFDGRKKLYMPTIDAPVVERTGCGDAFGVGFMAAWMMGKDLDTCLRWGTVNGSSVLGYIGPQKGLLRKEEIGEWLVRAQNVRVEEI